MIRPFSTLVALQQEECLKKSLEVQNLAGILPFGVSFGRLRRPRALRYSSTDLVAPLLTSAYFFFALPHAAPTSIVGATGA